MVELHGWATIRETTSVDGEENIDIIVQKIKSRIVELNWNSGVLDLKAVNGEYHLCVSCFTNRKGKDISDVFEFYEYIAKIAPGSYGLIYFRDDEDINGIDNIFMVYVLARGVIHEKKDVFLSPFTPVVEDCC